MLLIEMDPLVEQMLCVKFLLDPMMMMHPLVEQMIGLVFVCI